MSQPLESTPAPSYAYEKLRDTTVVAEATRVSMQGNRASETFPEVRLRRALWGAGARGYRKNVRKLPGAPDIVFTRQKLAIFVQGCFWHSCPRCLADRIPKTNSVYWETKLNRNKERDSLNQARLKESGWNVLVLWECELKGERLADAVETICQSLK